ncbi:hypothetical protein [Rhizobium tibeticum]|uniref:hypothetical protein n=1 Tax=Rhizobium tibeticum TaxID=501024 RepID=UPI0034D1A51C
MACAWASRGIRVTAIAPGYVRTPMIAELERVGKIDLAKSGAAYQRGAWLGPTRSLGRFVFWLVRRQCTSPDRRWSAA